MRDYNDESPSIWRFKFRTCVVAHGEFQKPVQTLSVTTMCRQFGMPVRLLKFNAWNKTFGLVNLITQKISNHYNLVDMWFLISQAVPTK